jgi:lysophospholipase L1-like esterase
VTNLVCGDAYIIEGQSNAVATDNSEPQVDTSYPWIHTYNATLGWGPAFAKPTSPNWDSKIGFWGMKMARQIVATYQIPVCIINGAVGGTRIDQHQPNPSNHTVGAGTYDIYANLLNRVTAAKLTHGIRGIFWHQGESDSGNAGPILDYDYTAYQQNFLNMSAAWKQDYPNFQRYLIFQVMPKPCAMGPKGDQLREAQRTLPYLYSKMSILNTLGIAGYEGCHFSKEGYENMADRILPVVYRDFYGVTPGGPITAPNLKRAYFTSPARTAIALEFDQAMSWSSFSTPNYFLDDVGGKVTSGSASGNVVTLQLNGPASANATLDYLKDDIWNLGESVSTLLYGANGIPALTFADVPVTALTPYEVWTGSAFANTFTNTTPSGDPDGDGITNQEEFAFGLDPTIGSSVNPITQQLTGGVFKYTRTKNSGLTYKVYYSTDLSGWTLDAAATQTPAAAVAGIETVTVTLAAATPSNGKLFVRVEATPTP